MTQDRKKKFCYYKLCLCQENGRASWNWFAFSSDLDIEAVELRDLINVFCFDRNHLIHLFDFGETF